MHITFFSFIVAVFWSSLFIVMTYCLRKTNCGRHMMGVLPITLLYLFSAFRMFVSIEIIPSVVVESRQIYPAIYRMLRKTCFTGSRFQGTILSFAIAIWLGVAAVLLIRYGINYYAARRCVTTYTESGDEQVRAMNLLIANKTNTYKIPVYISRDVSTSFGMGIFKRAIIMPDRAYQEDELYYILLHEYTHFKNKDIWVKTLVSLFCILFWWNPLVYLLKKDLEQTLEVKCDRAVLKRIGVGGKTAYLETLLHALKQMRRTQKMSYAATTFLQPDRDLEIKERFGAIAAYKGDNSIKKGSVLIIVAFSCLMMVSYVFLPQPVYEAPYIANEFVLSESRLEKTANGHYELFIRGESEGMISDASAEVFINEGIRVDKGE